MLEINFGKKTEPTFFLDKSKDLLVVRTRSKHSVCAPYKQPLDVTALHKQQIVRRFPEAGVEVFKTTADDAHNAAIKAHLKEMPDVRFAGSALIDPNTHEPVVYTENIFIKFIDTLDSQTCKRIIQEADLSIKQLAPYARNAYFVAAKEGTGLKIFNIALDLLKREEVEYCHPEIIRHRSKRIIHPNQWHLKKTTIAVQRYVLQTYTKYVDASANVEAAHKYSQGKNVIIAIIDDAIDIDHPEFSGAGKIIAPYSISTAGIDHDPRPKNESEIHGTACAGVACANGKYGASGVAPEAALMPIRLSVSLGSVLEANVFYWAAIGGASVISCSWGPPDRGGAESDQCFPLPASTRLAIDYAVTHGRYGKGCLIFFAAGNGNENMDTDAYASYEKTIAVAACNDKSRKSQYSDYGRAVWCAFPSSDSMSESPETGTTDSCGIWTTDVRGIEAGYNTGKTSDPFGNYAPEFGGTSSASPGAAGVAALVLAVNPNLYWEEVKQILADTCDKISHPEEGELGQYNALGHSHYYGYGRLNAEKAVLLARMRLDNAILPPQIEKPLHNCR